MTTLIAGIWFVLWLNGSSDWTDYDGGINFGERVCIVSDEPD